MAAAAAPMLETYLKMIAFRFIKSEAFARNIPKRVIKCAINTSSAVRCGIKATAPEH